MKQGECQTHIRQAYEEYKLELGEEHSNTLNVMQLLGSVFYITKDYENAKLIYENVYEKRRLIQGVENTYTILALEELICTYAELIEQKKVINIAKIKDLCEPLYVLKKQKNGIFGISRRSSIFILDEVGYSYRRPALSLLKVYAYLGEHKKAKVYKRQIEKKDRISRRKVKLNRKRRKIKY